MTEKTFSIKPWLIGLVVVLLTITPVSMLLFYFSGWTTGEEFSPDDFSRRRFSYNIIPFTNYTRRGIEYTDTTSVLAKTLVADQLISGPAQGAGQKTWHLIFDSKSNAELSNDFDAEILCQYLDLANREGENVWVVWNSKHDALAKTFWPIIQSLARNKIYWAMPPIMRRALSLETANDVTFPLYLTTAASRAYFQAGQEFQSEEDLNRAIEMFSLSIELRPGAPAYRARATCYRLMGNKKQNDAWINKALLDEQSALNHDK